MSAGIVREAFRTSLQAFFAGVVPPCPFIESITVEVVPEFPLWATASFFPVLSEATTCGDVETGTCQISVFGQGGVGDGPVIEIADQVRAFFNANPLLDNAVSVARVSAPTEATSGDGVSWYGVTVAVDYLVKIGG